MIQFDEYFSDGLKPPTRPFWKNLFYFFQASNKQIQVHGSSRGTSQAASGSITSDSVLGETFWLMGNSLLVL